MLHCTRTHLTGLVRQLWVAFWGEQQAVVGTRRDGLYFCPQDPNPFVTRHLLPEPEPRRLLHRNRQSPWHADGSETNSRGDYPESPAAGNGTASKSCRESQYFAARLGFHRALPKLQLCSTNMAAVWAGNSHCSIVLSLRTSSNQPSWTST
jgi:hypothetical protein